MNAIKSTLSFEKALQLAKDLKTTASNLWEEPFLILTRDYDGILIKESDYLEKNLSNPAIDNNKKSWLKSREYNLNIFFAFRQLVNRYRQINKATLTAKAAETENLKDGLALAYCDWVKLHKDYLFYKSLDESMRKENEFWHKMAMDLLKENQSLRNQLKSL